MNDFTIHPGNCLDVMPTLKENSVDAIVTDPPYGLGFMGKAWDTFKPDFVSEKTKGYRVKPVKEGLDKRITKQVDSPALYAGLYDQSLEGHRNFQTWCESWAREALRVAKPGAHMLICGGTRTFHRMTSGIEDAGWEIRDCFMWLYGSGFPKSLDVSKAIDRGAGKQRNTSYVPNLKNNNYGKGMGGGEWNAAREPPVTNAARQWSGWGTALKPAWEPIIVARKPIEGTVAENVQKWGCGGMNIDEGRIECGERLHRDATARTTPSIFGAMGGSKAIGITTQGRWPANVILDEEAGKMLDGQSGNKSASFRKARTTDPDGIFSLKRADKQPFGHHDSGGASRFFYCAKASKRERGEGNNHPTVKPISLLQYLIKLVCPPSGTILDPFMGSGSTLVAAQRLGFKAIGIEKELNYCEIAEKRLNAERMPVYDGEPMNFSGEVK